MDDLGENLVRTEEEDDFGEMAPAEAYRLAKIDHYLQQIRDYIDMGRYLAAVNSLATVFALDRGNEEGKLLRKSVDDFLSEVPHRMKKEPGLKNENGTSVNRTRREELVMIVDQDERLLVSLTATLRRYGFLAVGAASYEEAVQTFTMMKPDVVISEVNFEGGSRGFDLYLWLKTHPGNEELPFLFLATRIDRETLIAGKRFGVDDLIMKPVDDEVVIASVINCLTRRKGVPVHA